MITHIFFDAGNTLVYVNMEIVSQALARRGVRVAPSELARGEHVARRLVDDPGIIRQTDDHLRWKIYFEAVLRECGVTRPRLTQPVLEELEEYHRAYNLWDAVPPEVPLLLDRLRRRYRLGVISNANGTVRDKLQRAGLAPYFDVIIDSHEERVEKPDPRIFRLAMDRAWALPHRSVHVGDMFHVDLVGARAAGMRAILLDPAGIHADKPALRITSLDALVPHLS